MTRTVESKNESSNDYVLTDADFKHLSARVMDLTGIVLKEEKRALVYSRISKRLRALKMNSFSDYCKLIDKSDSQNEIGYLINAITTNLTRFFREEHHFDYIKNTLIPHLVERYHHDPRPENRRVRFWSAGCSSGEEPYSLAMTLAAHMPSGFDVKILATDIDTNMLQKGSDGIYSDKKGIPVEYFNRFCTKQTDGSFKINRSVADLITFKPLNLLEHWPMKGPFNLVFCRNVVIYFNKETQSTLFNRIADLIEDHGWLFIGHSESLFKVCDRFTLKGQTMYQKDS